MQDVFLLELDRSEVAVLRRKLRGDRHESSVLLDTELSELQPHKGFVIEAPADAVDRIRLLSGGAHMTRLAYAVVSSDGARTQRAAIIERDIAYVTKMIMAQRARDVVRLMLCALDTAKLALADHAADPALDSIGPRAAIDNIMEAGMNALQALKRLR